MFLLLLLLLGGVGIGFGVGVGGLVVLLGGVGVGVGGLVVLLGGVGGCVGGTTVFLQTASFSLIVVLADDVITPSQTPSTVYSMMNSPLYRLQTVMVAV